MMGIYGTITSVPWIFMQTVVSRDARSCRRADVAGLPADELAPLKVFDLGDR